MEHGKILPKHHILGFTDEGPQTYILCREIDIGKNGRVVQVVRGAQDGIDYVRKVNVIDNKHYVWHEGDDLGEDDDEEGPNEVLFASEPLPAQFFPERYEWSDLTTAEDIEQGQRRYGMIMKFYNGRTLEHLYNWCMATYSEVPEWFIWFVVGQLARAIAYLHLGYWDDPEEEEPPNWIGPIIHRDIAWNNVLLHWNDDRADSHYPQMVLADFGLASRLDDAKWPVAVAEENAASGDVDLPRHDLYEDIQLLGNLLCDLFRPQPKKGPVDDESPEENISILNPDELQRALDAHDGDNYTENWTRELRDLVRTLLPDWDHMPDQNYPDSHWLIDDLIPLSDDMLERLNELGQVERPVNYSRPVINNKIHFIYDRRDLFARRTGRLDSTIPQYQRARPWEVFEVSMKIHPLKLPAFAEEWRGEKRKYIKPWLHPKNRNRNPRDPYNEDISTEDEEVSSSEDSDIAVKRIPDSETRAIKGRKVPGRKKAPSRAVNYYLTVQKEKTNRKWIKHDKFGAADRPLRTRYLGRAPTKPRVKMHQQ